VAVRIPGWNMVLYDFNHHGIYLLAAPYDRVKGRKKKRRIVIDDRVLSVEFAVLVPGGDLVV
jgi:hypothetical protein